MELTIADAKLLMRGYNKWSKMDFERREAESAAERRPLIIIIIIKDRQPKT
jgi:hypothetical protein